MWKHTAKFELLCPDVISLATQTCLTSSCRDIQNEAEVSKS